MWSQRKKWDLGYSKRIEAFDLIWSSHAQAMSSYVQYHNYDKYAYV